MTLDGLCGLIAFLRGGIMSDRDERTGDGSRESWTDDGLREG